MSHRKNLITGAAVALAVAGSFALTSSAEAKHRHHHMRAHGAAAPVLVPAHQRPEFVGAAGYPGLIDLGLGPVFPFGGWPKSL